MNEFRETDTLLVNTLSVNQEKISILPGTRRHIEVFSFLYFGELQN